MLERYDDDICGDLRSTLWTTCGADAIPHRVEGESTLLEFVPVDARRILDVGSGGGRLLALVKGARPGCEFVGLDFSPTKLETLHKLFAGDNRVTIVSHDFGNGLPATEPFDAVSSFAIHYVSHQRKRALYREILELLDPNGVVLQSGTRCICESAPACRIPAGHRGCARSASWMWSATGSGLHWHCSRVSSQP